MLKTPVSLLLTLLCLALPVASCGGSGTSKSDYRKQVQKIGQEFRAEVDSTQRKLASATTDADRIKALDAFRASFDRLANKIDGLSAPDGAQAAQDKLVRVLHKGADDIGKVESAVKAKNRANATQAARDLQQDAATAQTALGALRAKVQ
jgi:hypothetical protein